MLLTRTSSEAYCITTNMLDKRPSFGDNLIISRDDKISLYKVWSTITRLIFQRQEHIPSCRRMV